MTYALSRPQSVPLVCRGGVVDICAPNPNTVQLTVPSCRRAGGRVMSDDDVRGRVGVARALCAPWAQREITHLALDAARDDASLTRADAHRAQFGQHVAMRLLLASHGPRGESPPHAGGCGG